MHDEHTRPHDQPDTDVPSASEASAEADQYAWMDLAIEAGQLREAMVARASIEQAKGWLVGVCDITLDAAFTVLQGVSQNRNIKLRDLAAALMELTHAGGLPGAVDLTPAHHAAAALMVRVGKPDPLGRRGRR